MARRTCPFCKKSISEDSLYCIYCSGQLDAIPKEKAVHSERPSKKSRHYKGLFGLAVTVISVLLIATIVLLVILFPPNDIDEQNTDSSTAPVTTTTRDAVHDEWTQTFLGQWVDEQSAGKKRLESQGGYILYIHEVFRDDVTFDLLSYQGGESGDVARLSGVKSRLYDNTLHFTFKDDGLGHGGEGFLRLTDNGIQMEVRIDDKDLAEGEHSLAVYSVFKRRSLPKSKGFDIQSVDSIDTLKDTLGKQTAKTYNNKKGQKVHTFGAMKVFTDSKGKLLSVLVDFSLEEDKTKYCFDGIDGTMSYDTVKMYFGEALHDYVEQPTNIRVLHYQTEDAPSVTFTFDAENNMLMKIVHDI